MIEVKRDDFFVESIKNPIEYGTYYKINPKYGTGFQWTSEVHHDFIITATDIRFNQETMVGEHIGSGYVLALYISGAGDEFYPYQNISPNTLRCYEPSEKYKAIYHPQIPLRCITVQVDQEFIDQYLQEISGDLEVNFSDFFKEKGKFYLPNVNSNRGQNAFFYDAAEGLLTSAILMLAEFLPPDKEHPQERRHIVSVFKLVQDLLEPSKVKGKSHFQLLMGKLPPDHLRRTRA